MQNQTREREGASREYGFMAALAWMTAAVLLVLGWKSISTGSKAASFAFFQRWVHRAKITLISLQTGWTSHVSLPNRFVCIAVFEFLVFGFYLGTTGSFSASRTQIPKSQFAFLQFCSVLSQTLSCDVFLWQGFG